MEASTELKSAVREYREGNREAFTILYQESSRYLYTCIYKVVRGNDNAEDIVNDIMQDSYEEISRSIGQLEQEERFLQWAGTIATRKCYAYFNKGKKYVLANDEEEDFTEIPADEKIIPETIMQDLEKQRLVREIIETRLTQMQKLCIIAYYYHEMKQGEIAEELGIPENTVKTNLARGKAKIREGVLDLEKNQGTKLYSLAPFMLLLLGEELKNTQVPAQITGRVLQRCGVGAAETAKAAGGSTAGTAAAGTAEAAQSAGAVLSLKGILAIAAVVTGVAVVGAVAASNLSNEDEVREVAERSASKDRKHSAEGENDEGENLGNIGFFRDQDEKEQEENKQEKSKQGEREPEPGYLFSKILLDPAAYADYYPQGTEFGSLRFAYADADGDGVNEVIVGDNYSAGLEAPQRIINVLDFRDNEVVDFDGDRFYECLGGWQLYDTGVLWTELGMGDNKTFYWNLNTGEEWEAYTGIMAPGGTSALDRYIVKFVQTPEGEVVEGDAASALKKELTAGTNQRLRWFPCTKESVELVLLSGSGMGTGEAVEITENEREKFRILAQFTAAQRWGERIRTGNSVQADQRLAAKFIVRLSNENFESDGWPYAEYLPERIDKGNQRSYYSLDGIRKYIKEVFDAQLDEKVFRERTQNYEFTPVDGLYEPYEYQYSSSDICEITRVEEQDGRYYVYGTDIFAQWSESKMEKVIISAFEFIMVLHPNENSPFGFTFEKIVFNPAELLYRSDELSAQEKDAEGTTPVPRGAFYDGTGIQQLDFADDGTVRYSPKGAPRTYTYVIDPAGRLIINDEGGATEARYLAEEDVIWYYGQYYYRE